MSVCLPPPRNPSSWWTGDFWSKSINIWWYFYCWKTRRLFFSRQVWFFFYYIVWVLGSLWTGLLCIMEELAGVGYTAVANGVSVRGQVTGYMWQVTGDRSQVTGDRWHRTHDMGHRTIFLKLCHSEILASCPHTSEQRTAPTLPQLSSHCSSPPPRHTYSGESHCIYVIRITPWAYIPPDRRYTAPVSAQTAANK